MNDCQLGEIESRFADIIWNCEPISTNELCKKSEEEFKWKKSTTYTVLKRLCEKGIFINKKGVVTSLVSREEFYSIRSERFLKDNFGGSLPAFVAAFTKRKAISKEEIDEIKKMIDEYGKE